MSNKTALNVTSLLNETSSTNGQSLPAIISSSVIEIKDFEMSQLPSEMSDKPCSDAVSSQSPPTIKVTGSLDALLYIVIVLMFYAFSIVILMIKYIRREREEANLRSYYHEFVSREKFKCAQFRNRQCMKRIFSRHEDFDQHGLSCLANESRCSQALRNNLSDIHKCSRVLINTEEERTKESFTFLEANSQFCKNTRFGKNFCNKQLCSICVSENVPAIDWGEDHNETNDSGCEVNKIIEVTLHQAVMKDPQFSMQQPRCTSDLHEWKPCIIKEDNIFHPIMECGKEDTESIQSFFESGLHDVKKCSSNNEHRYPFVSSCSLEVSELLANMPPLGISKSPSNDMDTLDGLSNLDSEIENQSLLDYSSSIRLHQDKHIKMDLRNSAEDINGQFLNVIGNKDDNLSDRSSLHSCSFSLDDKSTCSGHFKANDVKMLADGSFNKTDTYIGTDKVPTIISSYPEREDDEMVRLLNDITVLADQSGVFNNLKYFLRGFYKSDTEDSTEHSILLPKETYFGPDSPKRLKTIDSFLKFGTNTERTNFSRDVSPDVICSQRNHWAYTHDGDDGITSDTDKSSSFGDYCMDETGEPQVKDLSKPLAAHDLDVLSCTHIGLGHVYPKRSVQPLKQNPMVAGYGPAHKETKV